MTQEQLKQTLKTKLKECDKDLLVDIIADICSMYVSARVLLDMSGVDNIQTNIQEVDNIITKRINAVSQRIDANLL
jgi:hypothetical protein